MVLRGLNGQKWPSMVQSGPKGRNWSKIYKNHAKWTKWIKLVQKWLKIVQSGQKWSKMDQNGSKWTKSTKVLWSSVEWCGTVWNQC